MKKISLFLMWLLVAAPIYAQQPYSMPSTPAVPFYVANARVDGAFFNTPNAITLVTDRTLLTRETGSVVILNSATGFTVTLPAPTVGLYYDFMVAATVTSGSLKIITDAGTTFLAGPIVVDSTGGTGPGTFPCNGSSHISIIMNGTTTGGVKGSWVRFLALSSTLWQVFGMIPASGAAATPCSAS